MAVSRKWLTNHTLSLKTTGIIQAVMNLLIGALFALLVMASAHAYVHSHSMRTLGVLAVNALFLALYLVRRPATVETDSLPLWLLALAGTAAPLLMRPTSAGGLAGGAVMQIFGLALLATALLSLRRSFAVVPANRGIRVGGLYQLVRHPVYMAELTVMLGVVLSNPTVSNGIVWICECGLQYARARAEERVLATDPAYTTYCTQVHYRLIPGII